MLVNYNLLPSNYPWGQGEKEREKMLLSERMLATNYRWDDRILKPFLQGQCSIWFRQRSVMGARTSGQKVMGEQDIYAA